MQVMRSKAFTKNGDGAAARFHTFMIINKRQQQQCRFQLAFFCYFRKTEKSNQSTLLVFWLFFSSSRTRCSASIHPI
jgi:hypothetical protein